MKKGKKLKKNGLLKIKKKIYKVLYIVFIDKIK